MRKLKKILTIISITILSLALYGCNSVEKVKDMMFENDPNVEFIRSDEDNIKVSMESNLRETVIYYENDKGYLVPIKRELPWEEGIGKAILKNMTNNVAIREDMGKIGFKPVIPSGTNILGMTVDEEAKLCKVDFSEEILNYETKKQEENLVKAVVYTLTEFPNIEEVQIMIEGKIVDSLKHGTNIGEPLKRENINLIQTSEASKDENYSRILVYYKGTNDKRYDYYVPITIPVSSPDVSIEVALKELFKKPSNQLKGLYTDIPNGVEFSSVDIEDGKVTLTLNLEDKDILKQQATMERMSKNIGLTLNQFEDVESIKFSINDETVEDTMPVFANEY